jgi:hypothetical protein
MQTSCFETQRARAGALIADGLFMIVSQFSNDRIESRALTIQMQAF